MKSVLKNAPPEGWVLYDDSCGFCRRWVQVWKETLKHRGFDVAPLQAGWVKQSLRLDEASLLNDLRLLRPDGTLIAGSDVYRQVARRIWWAWPVYLFSIAPVSRWVFDWGYRMFARNRFRFSSACGLAERKSFKS